MLTLQQVECAYILRVLMVTEGNKRAAARILDIARGTLYRKLEQYQIEWSK